MSQAISLSFMLGLVVAFGCGTAEPTETKEGSESTGDTSLEVTAPGPSDSAIEADVAESQGAEGVDGASAEAPRALVRHPDCDPADPEGDGAKVPWEGFQRGDTWYTCNTCRSGLEDLQGTWRLVDFATEDPDVVLQDDWRQTFTFDGNTWRQDARWVSDGVAQEASMEGWYWCSSKPEVGNETKVFIVTALTPTDAFGYAPGYVFTTDLLNSTEGGDKLAFWFYEGFNTGEQVAEIYCRVGDDVTTLDGDVKSCAAPWVQ
ncbi:MAG: hypothetical protein ACPGU1_08040 [Myxococcota bacterium]